MAVYAIGDLQGCYTALRRLLDKLKFDPTSDNLWFVGDLVNRGAESLATLRFVKSLGTSATSVLGNHDLHLLAVNLGVRKIHPKDTFDEILQARDRQELIAWLRQQPLLHHDPSLGFTMVHAGIYPFWNLDKARALAKEVEQVLAGDHYADLIKTMYGNQPSKWDDRLQGTDRLRFIINAFTRMRYCNSQGKLEFENKLRPGTQPESYLPWFEISKSINKETKIVFGHWSTLKKTHNKNIIALDKGCVWGGYLSAIDLQTSHVLISVKCE